jgi:hypothetical protein
MTNGEKKGNVDFWILIKVAEDSFATALANIVFPVPGGPVHRNKKVRLLSTTMSLILRSIKDRMECRTKEENSSDSTFEISA